MFVLKSHNCQHNNNNCRRLILSFFLLFFFFENLSVCCAFTLSNLMNRHSEKSQPLVLINKMPVSNVNGERSRHSSGVCEPGELFSREKVKCYKELSQGPCEKNMIFLKTLEDPTTGKCGCRPSLERAVIYHPKFQQCYKIFTQGPCDSGLWLVIQNGRPACIPDPCLFYKYYFTFHGNETFVPYQDDCVELNKPSPKCAHPKDEIISLIDKGKTPACVKRFPSSMIPLSLSSLDYLACANGTILSYDNECQDIVPFDLESNL